MNEATYEAIEADITDTWAYSGPTTITSRCGMFDAPNPDAEAAGDGWYYDDKALQELRDAGVKEGADLWEAWYGEAEKALEEEDVDENQLREAMDEAECWF